MKLGMCGFTIGASAYFKQFSVVEVQQTFYDPPPIDTLTKWRNAAPPDFEFTMKAWQVITHRAISRTYRRLRRQFSEKQSSEAGGFNLNETTRGAWQLTVECCAALRATAILFQCPPSFTPADENVRSMQRFIASIDRPENVRLLWEPRGKWPDELVLDLCRELDLIHAVDPFVRPSLTPELLYWRLHGNRSHYARYSDDELLQIVDWLPSNTATDCYVMFNNVPRVKDVRRFCELLAARS